MAPLRSILAGLSITGHLLFAGGLPELTALPSAWLAYLRAVYGGAEPDADLLSAVRLEDVRFIYWANATLIAGLAPLLDASHLSSSVAGGCAASESTRTFSRARYPTEQRAQTKCKVEIDPLHELGRYGSMLERCAHELGETSEERLEARRRLVHVADHSWVEVSAHPARRLRAPDPRSRWRLPYATPPARPIWTGLGIVWYGVVPLLPPGPQAIRPGDGI
jgi:hypothetical protein